MARVPTRGLLTEQELIEQEIQATLSFHEGSLRYGVATAIQACESPVERVLAASLVALADTKALCVDVMIYGRPRIGLPDLKYDALHIFPQVTIDGYRLDFLAGYSYEGQPDRWTVIEVDGHDFHERTKQQASHDKRRDRHFIKKGWQVLRYTGSDVWRSPSDCAREIIYTAAGYGEEA